MVWPSDPSDVDAIHPRLRAILYAELQRGNEVTQTWRGWPRSGSVCVMLRRRFDPTSLAAIEGLSYQLVDDPHSWAEELVHERSGHFLLTAFSR